MILAPCWRAIFSVSSVEPESTTMYSSPGCKVIPAITRPSVLVELKVRISTDMPKGFIMKPNYLVY